MQTKPVLGWLIPKTNVPKGAQWIIKRGAVYKEYFLLAVEEAHGRAVFRGTEAECEKELLLILAKGEEDA